MQQAIRLLAYYLDFLLFSAVLSLSLHAFGNLLISFGSDFGFALQLWLVATVLAVIFSLLAAVTGLSPGRLTLGRMKLLAEASRLSKLAWVNLIIGTLLFLDGTKHLVRWTQMERPLPFMGFVPEGITQVVIDVSLGIVFLILAVLLLRLTAMGKWFSAAVLIGSAASVAISWNQYPQAIERMVEARRKLQGIPVREGEIAAIQAYLPTFEFTTITAMLLVVLFAYVHRVDA